VVVRLEATTGALCWPCEVLRALGGGVNWLVDAGEVPSALGTGSLFRGGGLEQKVDGELVSSTRVTGL